MNIEKFLCVVMSVMMVSPMGTWAKPKPPLKLLAYQIKPEGLLQVLNSKIPGSENFTPAVLFEEPDEAWLVSDVLIGMMWEEGELTLYWMPELNAEGIDWAQFFSSLNPDVSVDDARRALLEQYSYRSLTTRYFARDTVERDYPFVDNGEVRWGTVSTTPIWFSFPDGDQTTWVSAYRTVFSLSTEEGLPGLPAVMPLAYFSDQLYADVYARFILSGSSPEILAGSTGSGTSAKLKERRSARAPVAVRSRSDNAENELAGTGSCSDALSDSFRNADQAFQIALAEINHDTFLQAGGVLVGALTCCATAATFAGPFVPEACFIAGVICFFGGNVAIGAANIAAVKAAALAKEFLMENAMTTYLRCCNEDNSTCAFWLE